MTGETASHGPDWISPHAETRQVPDRRARLFYGDRRPGRHGQRGYHDGKLDRTARDEYVSNGDYGVRSDNFGSLTWLGNTGERGFFRIAEARGWLRPFWYWTGIGAGFELWRGGQGLRVTDFSADS